MLVYIGFTKIKRDFEFYKNLEFLEQMGECKVLSELTA